MRRIIRESIIQEDSRKRTEMMADVEVIQLDNPDDFLTPQPDDNFSQQSAMNLDGFEDWPGSSLSKAYRRKDDRTPTLLALWNLDILQMS